MKQYKFTVVVRSPMDIKDIVWAFTHKLKDAFTVVSLDFAEIDTRPTSTEHHGGVTEDEVLKESYYKDGVSSEHTEEWLKRNIPERY